MKPDRDFWDVVIARIIGLFLIVGAGIGLLYVVHRTYRQS